MSEQQGNKANYTIRKDSPITATTIQEHIVTSPDRIENCLVKFKNSHEHKVKTQVFGGVLLTLLIALATTKEYQGVFNIPPHVVQAAVIIAFVVALIYFIINLTKVIASKGGMSSEVFAAMLSTVNLGASTEEE